MRPVGLFPARQKPHGKVVGIGIGLRHTPGNNRKQRKAARGQKVAQSHDRQICRVTTSKPTHK
jgi:hypothetical protein